MANFNLTPEQEVKRRRNHVLRQQQLGKAREVASKWRADGKDVVEECDRLLGILKKKGQS